MSHRYVLGISAFYHDSAAALLRDGVIVAAVSEDRFTRRKGDATFPHRAVEYCLGHAGIGVGDLTAVGFYDKPLLKFERILETYLGVVPAGFKSFLMAGPLWIKDKLYIDRQLHEELGYTGPIFTMIGAAYLLGEKMRWDRWVAAIVGFCGVMIVVGPRLAGTGDWYSLVMLASAPVFSLSFLLTKLLTRRDSPAVIVAWQGITVSVLSMPLALWFWTWPTPTQWLLFAVAGVLGSVGHFCLTHSLKAADMSASQPVKFLDLLWATMWGFLVWGDMPSSYTLAGGIVIVGATIWIARRESRRAQAEAIGR